MVFGTTEESCPFGLGVLLFALAQDTYRIWTGISLAGMQHFGPPETSVCDLVSAIWFARIGTPLSGSMMDHRTHRSFKRQRLCGCEAARRLMKAKRPAALPSPEMAHSAEG